MAHELSSLPGDDVAPVADLISDAAMGALCKHYWPGNVRELRNLIEATVAMGEPPELGGEAHPPAPAPGGGDPIAPLLDLPYGRARGTLLHEFEGRYLRQLMERSKGNVSRAAREARMDRSHLIDLLRRHDIH